MKFTSTSLRMTETPNRGKHAEKLALIQKQPHSVDAEIKQCQMVCCLLRDQPSVDIASLVGDSASSNGSVEWVALRCVQIGGDLYHSWYAGTPPKDEQAVLEHNKLLDKTMALIGMMHWCRSRSCASTSTSTARQLYTSLRAMAIWLKCSMELITCEGELTCSNDMKPLLHGLLQMAAPHLRHKNDTSSAVTFLLLRAARLRDMGESLLAVDVYTHLLKNVAWRAPVSIAAFVALRDSYRRSDRIVAAELTSTCQLEESRYMVLCTSPLSVMPLHSFA